MRVQDVLFATAAFVGLFGEKLILFRCSIYDLGFDFDLITVGRKNTSTRRCKRICPAIAGMRRRIGSRSLQETISRERIGVREWQSTNGGFIGGIASHANISRGLTLP